jgi:hypothetical protein
MNPAVRHKIVRLSKDICFDASRKHKSNSHIDVPYDCRIVRSELYPKNLFLVHSVMNFNAGSLEKTYYEIYKFDVNGKYLGEVDIQKLDRDFFRNQELIEDIK